MLLTLAEPRYLKDSITIISDLVNEARFKVNKDGIELVAMDPANVAMVIFRLLSSAFTEYSIKQPLEIGINLDNLKQVLRRVNPQDMLTLSVEENKLTVQAKGATTRTFKLPLLDIEEKEHKIPELTFTVTVKTDSQMFTSAIEDADIVAESVSLVAEPSKLTVQAEGDLSKASIEIKEGDTTKIVIDGSAKIRAKYSIEYLKKMISGAKIAENVDVFFSQDYPLRLDYKALDKVSLSFILAPRVEND